MVWLIRFIGIVIIILPGEEQGVVKVFLANGTGTFNSAIYVDKGHSKSEYTRYYFADVDGKNGADMIYWNPTNDHTSDGNGTKRKGTLKIFLSNGNGTFKNAIYDPNGWSASHNTKYYFADVNNDGKADKIYWNRNYQPSGQKQGVVKVFLAKGDGTFHSAIYVDKGNSTSSYTRYFFTDVDGKNGADMIYWNPTNDHTSDGNGTKNKGTLKIFLSNGNGTF